MKDIIGYEQYTFEFEYGCFVSLPVDGNAPLLATSLLPITD